MLKKKKEEEFIFHIITRSFCVTASAVALLRDFLQRLSINVLQNWNKPH